MPCCYRIAQDGLPALLPHLTKQRFTPTVDELLALLEHRCACLGCLPAHLPAGYR